MRKLVMALNGFLAFVALLLVISLLLLFLAANEPEERLASAVLLALILITGWAAFFNAQLIYNSNVRKRRIRTFHLLNGVALMFLAAAMVASLRSAFTSGFSRDVGLLLVPLVIVSLGYWVVSRDRRAVHAGQDVQAVADEFGEVVIHTIGEQRSLRARPK